MITVKNYLEQTKDVDFSKMQDALKDGKKFVDENIDLYKYDDNIKKYIDAFVNKLNASLAHEKTDEKPPTKKAPEKKMAPKSPAAKKQTPQKNRTVKKVATKAKPATEAKQVAQITPEVRFIKRYVLMDGKRKSRKQLLTFINSLQRAIEKKIIRKTSTYAKEIMHIQNELLKIYNDKDVGETFKFSLDATDKSVLQKYQKIAGSQKQRVSVRLISRYIGIHGKTNVKEKAERLLKAIKLAYSKKQVPSSDPYRAELKKVQANLETFLKAKEARLLINKTDLKGLQGIAGVGEISDEEHFKNMLIRYILLMEKIKRENAHKIKNKTLVVEARDIEGSVEIFDDDISFLFSLTKDIYIDAYHKSVKKAKIELGIKSKSIDEFDLFSKDYDYDAVDAIAIKNIKKYGYQLKNKEFLDSDGLTFITIGILETPWIKFVFDFSNGKDTNQDDWGDVCSNIPGKVKITFKTDAGHKLQGIGLDGNQRDWYTKANKERAKITLYYSKFMGAKTNTPYIVNAKIMKVLNPKHEAFGKYDISLDMQYNPFHEHAEYQGYMTKQKAQKILTDLGFIQTKEEIDFYEPKDIIKMKDKLPKGWLEAYKIHYQYGMEGLGLIKYNHPIKKGDKVFTPFGERGTVEKISNGVAFLKEFPGQGFNVDFLEMKGVKKTGKNLRKKMQYHGEYLGSITAKQLADIEYETFGFTGKWKSLIGDPAKPFSLMFWSKPGKGKSTLAIELAKYMATEFGQKVLFVAAEEGLGYTLKEKFGRLKAYDDNIFIVSELPENLNPYDVIVLDSVTRMKMMPNDFVELRKKYPHKSFILVFQSTGDGGYRGSKEWEHEVDVAIFINENGYAKVSKGRFGGEGTLKVFKGTPDHIYKFTNLQDAEKFVANRQDEKLRMVQGDDGKIWVTNADKAAELKKQGYLVY